MNELWCAVDFFLVLFRWCVLTGNSLDYYKSYVKNSPKFGSIVLTSLCSVVSPEEREPGKILNNYWMRLSMISWIIKTEVCVICRSRRLRQTTQTRGFDNSWYHAKTEFNNCFIIHFHIIHPQKQKRSVQPFCFWEEHSKGLNNQSDVELDMINAISAAGIAFIMSSSQAIVNWLNALDQSDFS